MVLAAGARAPKWATTKKPKCKKTKNEARHMHKGTVVVSQHLGSKLERQIQTLARRKGADLTPFRPALFASFTIVPLDTCEASEAQHLI